jgi:hypothetical protein
VSPGSKKVCGASDLFTFPEGTVLAFSPDMSAPLTRNRIVPDTVLSILTKGAEAHYVV